MVTLRADPRVPEFGAEVSAALDDPDHEEVQVDPFVESRDWTRAIEPSPPPPAPVVFVDGVRRVDLRVLARDEGRRSWGLLGSWAVGAVRCDGAAAVVAAEPRRAVVLGGGLRPEPVRLEVGRSALSYEPRATAGDQPFAILQELQNAMREHEGRMASELAGDALVVADGPLHYPFEPGVVVVGVVKTMIRAYLDGEPAALLPRLRPGERTPLFALGTQALDRYAWYQRLVPLREPWHELSGLVRCEVRSGLGVDAARGAADRVAAILPVFAGRPGVDPRAPQNLTPVGALESSLRHRMGNPAVIRRALQAHLGGDR